jgi:hypothetical protein
MSSLNVFHIYEDRYKHCPGTVSSMSFSGASMRAAFYSDPTVRDLFGAKFIEYVFGKGDPFPVEADQALSSGTSIFICAKWINLNIHLVASLTVW